MLTNRASKILAVTPNLI